MEQILLLNPENVSEEEAAKYPVREAARAIVFDANKRVALLYAAHERYYKLPGGGIEEGEDRMLALRRECQEEIGFDIQIGEEVGVIIEYRKFRTLKQVSYCYTGFVKGEKKEIHYTADEIAVGLKHLWVPYEEAVRLIRTCKPTSLEGASYIAPRDSAFLDAALKIM